MGDKFKVSKDIKVITYKDLKGREAMTAVTAQQLKAVQDAGRLIEIHKSR